MTSSRPSPPVVIAEIGTAHGGDLSRGLDLVDACADAGADVAKVQVVFAGEILPPEAGLVPLPGGDTPLYDVFRSLEKPVEFYAALAERAQVRGLGFLASPFGERSVALLEEIGVFAWKVASPELNHEPLLERMARTGLPMILSTGVSKQEDIQRALEVIAAVARGFNTRRSPSPAGVSGAGGYPLVLLHCLTSYPAPEDQANLRLIPALAARWGLPAGLSDHSLDPVLLPALAAALGAVAIEKHITLDRSAGGLDDPVALTPAAFGQLTAAVRRFALPLKSPASEPDAPGAYSGTSGTSGASGATSGTGAPGPPDPVHLRSVVEELAGEYGLKRVEACLGDGIKRLAASEIASYGRTNRSIHAIGPLKAGTVLTTENTAILRTEKVLRPGIEPRYRLDVYGRKLARDVASGDGITRDDLA